MFHDVVNHDSSAGHNEAAQAVANLSRQLAHPLRVLLLTYVSDHGPCSFSELVEVAGAAQAQVGNHLTVLRGAGLLATERQGRQSMYRMPNAHLAEVLANLRAAVGAPEAITPADRPDRGEARRCYDHVGGQLGVAVLQALLHREAVVGDLPRSDELVPGPAATTVLPEFGVPDWTSLEGGRRRFAYGCPDWTEKAPHLGGALGAAVAETLHERRWTRRRPGSRTLELTPEGRRELRSLGVSL